MPDRGDPGLTLAGFLILAALGVFAWQKAPLESARPTNAQTDSYEFRHAQKMPARLWQDPFRALQIHRKNRQSPVVTSDGTSLAEDILAELQIGPDAEPGTPPDGKAQKQKKEQQEQQELIVITAAVPPGFYADIEERRRRDRYAILSALGDAGFVPRDPENLGLYYPDKSQPVAEKAEKAQGTEKPAAAPEVEQLPVIYEWYDFEDPLTGKPWAFTGNNVKKQSSILVLWVDNSWLEDAPFRHIGSLITDLLGCVPWEQRKQASWVVLGPPDSDTLLKMVESKDDESLEKIKQSGLARFYILSPYATVSKAALRRDPQGDEPHIKSPFDEYFPEACGEGETCMRFLRTIRSDDVLIEELIAELRRRNVDEQDSVVVLSEWDTYFGRFFPRALTEKFKQNDLCEAEPGNCPRIKRYTYERGIDGLAAGVVVTPPQGPGKKGKGAEDFHRDGANIRTPVGASQFDYLRRLADMIREDDIRYRYENGKGIRVVAILGTDIYDKLLILRALRDQVPGAIWITNDLDAHLLHPNEYPWTRNLVVASSFDLVLPDAYPTTAPPFRDSYQTSAYLAARLAIDACAFEYAFPDIHLDNAGKKCTGPEMPGELPDQEALYDAIPPLLFEVGRKGAVKLGTGSDPLVAINSAPPAAYLVSPFRAGFLSIAVLGILALHRLRPRSGRLVLYVTAILLVFWFFFRLVILPQLCEGEPFSLDAGVSIWPTEIIRLIALFLTGAFIWSCFKRLEYNWQCLNNRYFSGPYVARDTGLTLGGLWGKLFELRFNLRVWFIGVVALFFAMFMIMGSSMGQKGDGIFTFLLHFVVEGIAGDTGNRQLYATLLGRIFLFTLLIVLWFFFIFRWFPRNDRVKSINSWYEQSNKIDALRIWNQYHEYGALRHTILRSASMTLVYFTFGSIVFVLLGSASAPCRGAACGANGIITGISVLAMLFLLFLVVDVIRLCICWIKKIQDPEVRWQGKWFRDLSLKLHIPEPHLAYWLQVYLIGQRTHEVGRLLYYPVLIILLMLLARSTYFDNWVMPQALALIVGINFLIALVSAAHLNKTARTAREEILDRLRVEKMELSQGKHKPQPVVSTGELRELMEQLSQLKLGAYQNILDQPLVRATFLLLGGLGVTYSEYLPLLP